MPAPEGPGAFWNGVLLVGEALGEVEAAEGRPFAGRAGLALSQMLQRAGMPRARFMIDNALRCRPPFNKLAGQSYEREVIAHCAPFLDATIRQNRPKAVVALGDVAMRRMLGLEHLPKGDNLTKRRGFPEWSDRYQLWVVPTFHPSFLARGNRHLSQVFTGDIAKAVRIAKEGWQPFTASLLSDPDIETVARYVEEFERRLAAGEDLSLAYDIETPYKAEEDDEADLAVDDPTFTILRVGFAYEGTRAISLAWTSAYLPFIQRLLAAKCRKLTWNGRYDTPRLLANGMTINGQEWDLMWAWHIWRSDLPKGLAFVASVLLHDCPRWKHLANTDAGRYNALDAVITHRLYEPIVEGLRRSDLWHVFDRHILQLDEILLEMSKRGVLVDAAAREQLAKDLTAADNEAIQRATQVVPRSARRAKVFASKPKKLDESIVVEVHERKLKVCPNCGKVKPPKSHFRVLKKKVNPCAGLAPEERLLPVETFVRLEPWTPSNKQMTAYARAQGHEVVIVRKRGEDPKITFNDDALKVMMRRYPEDPLYPLVREERELATLASRYTGWWENGHISGGFPVGLDGRVHTTFLHNPSTLRLSSQAPNCFDVRTEVLTPKGWCRLRDLPEGEKVAQWDNGKIEFVAPLALMRRHYTGLMVNLKNDHIDLRVTGDHRCLQVKRSGIREVVPAVNFASDRKQLHGGVYDGPGVGKPWEWWILLCAAQADGSWVHGQLRPGLDFTFHKKRKAERLITALDALGVSYHYRFNGRRHRVRLHISPIVDELYTYLGKSKEFKGEWLLRASQEELKFFVDEVMRWDGCITRMNHYTSRNQNNAKLVQAAASLCGYRATLRTKCVRHEPFYEVDITRRDYSWTTNIEKTFEGVRDEEVYCLSVPSSFVLVRRGRAVMVTGQCQNIPRATSEWGKRIKDLFVPEPGFGLAELDFKAIEAVLVGYFARSWDYTRLAKLGVHDYLNGHILYRRKLIDSPPDVTWSDADLRACFKDLKKHFPKERDVAKRVVHLSNYLGTPRRMWELYPESFPSLKAAAELQAIYFEVAPAVRRWHHEVIEVTDNGAQLRNPYGYVHYFFAVKEWFKHDGKWEWKPGEDAKRAIAFMPQSTAAAIIKEAMLRLRAAGLDCWLRLQVHDSLLLCAPEAILLDIARQVRTIMEEPCERLPLSVLGQPGYLSIEVETKAGVRPWGSLEEVQL